MRVEKYLGISCAWVLRKLSYTHRDRALRNYGFLLHAHYVKENKMLTELWKTNEPKRTTINNELRNLK